MYDMNDSVGSEFTTSMLAFAICLETMGLVVFGVVVSAVTSQVGSVTRTSHYESCTVGGAGYSVVVSAVTSQITDGKHNLRVYKQKMETLQEFFHAKGVPFSLRKV
jgi:hypothetical protein